MTDYIVESDSRQMRKNILLLAWPAILRLFLQSVVGVVDVIMVGKIGPSAIASVDMGNRLVMVLIGTLMSLTIGATTLVAHHVGAGNREEANRILQQSLTSGFISAVIMALLGAIFSRSLLKLMMILMEEADPFILHEGSIYLRIVLISMIFGLPTMVINATLQGIGDMKTPLFVMLITNVSNVVFNYLLIFGIGFFPKMGVIGAALGTLLGRLAGFTTGLLVILKGKTGLKLNWRHITDKIDWEIIRNILKIGIPAAIEQFVRQGSQIVYTTLVAGLGTAAVAANAITMNINTLSFMPGFGFGMAATTLVGQCLGAKKEKLAHRYAKQSTYLAFGLMAFASVVLYIITHPMTALYTDDQEVASLAVSTLRIFILYQPLFSIFMVLAGALRGAVSSVFENVLK
jgi:putative MATE family efflux protein